MVRRLMIALSGAMFFAGAAPAPAQSKAALKAAELAKFNPLDSTKPSATGPGGGTWDSQYRSFIQTDENATSKGLPTHANASADIMAHASLSMVNLQQHKKWVLFILWGSKAYRPPEGTAALKAIYTDLVDLEFSAKPPPATSGSQADAPPMTTNPPTRNPARTGGGETRS